MKKTGLFFLGIILILTMLSFSHWWGYHRESYHRGHEAWKKGDYKQAEIFLKEGASRTKDQEAFIDVYFYNLLLLCDTQMKLEKYDEALKTCQEGLSVADRAYRKTSEPNVEMLAQSGTLYIERGEFDKALEVLKEAEQFSHTHPKKLVAIYNDLGTAYAGESRFEESRDSFEKGLKLSREVHGENHERTRTIQKNLGDLKAGRLQ